MKSLSVAITIPLKEHLKKTMAEADPDYDASHDLESEVETEDEDLTDEVRRICDKPAIFLTIFFKFVKLYYAVFLPFFCRFSVRRTRL